MNLDEDFWCGSPSDRVLHPLHVKKYNPFGAVSSPRAYKASGAGFRDSTQAVDSVGSGVGSMSSGLGSNTDSCDVGMDEASDKVRQATPHSLR